MSDKVFKELKLAMEEAIEISSKSPPAKSTVQRDCLQANCGWESTPEERDLNAWVSKLRMNQSKDGRYLLWSEELNEIFDYIRRLRKELGYD